MGGNMSHIISDKAYNEYMEFKDLGKSPVEIKDMIAYAEDEAPLPLVGVTTAELNNEDWQKDK